MASLNRVFILGNLGRDPELRYTQSQTAVATLNVATTDFRMVDGQRQDQTEWHRIVVWGKQAENCSKYLKKGRTVFVEGKLQTRSWDDKATGAKRYSTEVVAQNVRFIGGGQRAEGGYGGAQGSNDFESPSMDSGPDMGMPDVGFGGSDSSGMDEIPF